MVLRFLARIGVVGCLVLTFGCSSGPRPRPIVWQPRGETEGQPPAIDRGVLVLHGQSIRSEAVYTAPVVIECEVELVQGNAEQAAFEVALVPETGTRRVVAVAWGEPPLNLVAGQSYVIALTASPKSRITVNGLGLSGVALAAPAGPFQIELTGRPARSQWRLRRLVVQ